MENLFECLLRFLDKNSYDFKETEDKAFTFLVRRTEPLLAWHFKASVSEILKRIMLHGYCPIKIPQEKRKEVGNFILQLNNDYVFTGIILDDHDGTLRYRSCLLMKNHEMDEEDFQSMLIQAINVSVFMLDLIFMPVLRIIFSEMSGEEVYRNHIQRRGKNNEREALEISKLCSTFSLN